MFKLWRHAESHTVRVTCQIGATEKIVFFFGGGGGFPKLCLMRPKFCKHGDDTQHPGQLKRIVNVSSCYGSRLVCPTRVLSQKHLLDLSWNKAPSKVGLRWKHNPK